MPADATELRELLQSMRTRCLALTERLREAADALRTTGIPPAEELLTELRQLREAGLAIHSRVGATLPRDELSLDRLEELVNAFAWKQCRGNAELVLSAILRMRHTDGEIAPLAECHSQARRLIGMREHSAEIAAELEEVAGRNHPLHCLVRLVRSGHELNDEEWNQCHEQVQDALGTALGSAAARGKLIIAGSATPPNYFSDCFALDDADIQEPARTRTQKQELAEAAAMALEAARLEQAVSPYSDGESTTCDSTSAKPIETSVAPLVAADLPLQLPRKVNALATNGAAAHKRQFADSASIFDDDSALHFPPGDQQVPSDPHENAVVSSEAMDSTSRELIFGEGESTDDSQEPDSTILKASRFVEPEGPTAELAKAALQAEAAERSALMADLILYLIYEGRSGLAYHLASCLEQHDSRSKPFLPAWLIHAWTMGQAIRFSSGKLAGLLQEDLEQFTPRLLDGHDRNWSAALGYFVRAVTLRPTLVAPKTQAGSVLRSFEMHAESIRLYNYCSRIITYGERIGGISPWEVHSVDPASRVTLISQLKHDVGAWRSRLSELNCRYIPVSPLYQRAHWSLRSAGVARHPREALAWQRWQQLFHLAEPIIKCIEQDRFEDASTVRSRLEELSQRVEESRGPGRVDGVMREIQAGLREALTFGERWLALSHPSVEEVASQDLDELREELRQRHEQVFEELQFIAECHETLEIRIGLACLMLAMQQVRDVVQPQSLVHEKEPDPRHLLHSELLKIPSLQLDVQWEPTADIQTVEHELLLYLCSPQPDWATAFQIQASHHHHDATSRIASLDVWSKEDRETLLALRERQLHRTREELLADLESTERMIVEASRLEILSPHDRVGFDARLLQLKRHLLHDADLGASVCEMERLRDALERHRSREVHRTPDRPQHLVPNAQLPQPGAETSGWKTHFFGLRNG